MEIKKKLILGFTDRSMRRSSLFREINHDELIKRYSSEFNYNGRLLLALGQYLQHTNKFGKIFVYINNQIPPRFDNGTVGGIPALVNRSQVDIDVTILRFDEGLMETVDLVYPFKIVDHTFVTLKPEYKPHVFGIFQTFSLNVWLTLASFLFAITILSYFVLKYKCSIGKVVFHIFSVLMKQNARIVPSSFAENLLVYSWVIGAMVLCLSHDSVILSFLSFPPLTKIKHLSDLAAAVERGDCNCIAGPDSGIADYLRDKGQEHFGVIADDISKNSDRFFHLLKNFGRGNKTTELAYFSLTDFLDFFAEKYFISEDRFFQVIASMSVPRGFYYKELVDTFVHRMMASGIYFKYYSDFTFLKSPLFRITGIERTNRKLTLTDLAPAFIFLLCGYFISLSVLFWEMVSSRRNRRILKKVKTRRIKIALNEISV